MAETLISPGVLARENDQSFVTSQPVERGAAIIGPTVLGPIERPTLVSSFSAFQAIFGGALESGSNEYTYLTSIAANQYFQNGEAPSVLFVPPGAPELVAINELVAGVQVDEADTTLVTNNEVPPFWKY